LSSKIDKSGDIIRGIKNCLDESDNDTSTNLVSEEKESRLKRLEEKNQELKETIVELAIELYGRKNKI
jgi:DNA-binding transcriptional MerR regulator